MHYLPPSCNEDALVCDQVSCARPRDQSRTTRVLIQTFHKARGKTNESCCRSIGRRAYVHNARHAPLWRSPAKFPASLNLKRGYSGLSFSSHLLPLQSLQACLSIGFTVNELPTSPSSPRWEGPRRSTPPTRRPLFVVGLGIPKQPLGQGVKKLTLQFCDLIGSNPAVKAVDDFLADWRMEPVTEGEVATLHPLILEWFSESDAMEVCLKLEEHRKDIAMLLLAYGIQVNDRAIRPLMHNTLKTNDTEILEWLLDHEQ